jgi:hypothetical protein
MSSVQRFAVVVPSIPGYRHAGAFREVADAVLGGLRSLGHDVVASDTLLHRGRRSVIFGAHLLEPSTLPAASVIYNLEQVTALRADLAGSLRAHTVWDYSSTNVERWRAHDVTAVHVPLGYVPELTRVARVDETELDVLFYGVSSPRRRHIVEALEREGLNVLAFDRLYGEMRDGIMGRSKIILNASCFDEHRVFEAVRVSYALSNRLCVVSENGKDDDDYRDGALIVPYDELVGACVRAVRDPALRREYAERGFRLMQSRPESEILRKVLS